MTDCHDCVKPLVRWNRRPDGLEESVQFIPGWNCTDRTMQGHGVHGMEIHWYLRGPAGAAYFTLGTNWVPGTLSPGHGLSPDGENHTWHLYPMGIDLGVHSPCPLYDGHRECMHYCSLIGAPCYVTGSGAAARQTARAFVLQGEPAVFAELMTSYTNLTADTASPAVSG